MQAIEWRLHHILMWTNQHSHSTPIPLPQAHPTDDYHLSSNTDSLFELQRILMKHISNTQILTPAAAAAAQGDCNVS